MRRSKLCIPQTAKRTYGLQNPFMPIHFLNALVNAQCDHFVAKAPQKKAMITRPVKHLIRCLDATVCVFGGDSGHVLQEAEVGRYPIGIDE